MVWIYQSYYILQVVSVDFSIFKALLLKMNWVWYLWDKSYKLWKTFLKCSDEYMHIIYVNDIICIVHTHIYIYFIFLAINWGGVHVYSNSLKMVPEVIKYSSLEPTNIIFGKIIFITLFEKIIFVQMIKLRILKCGYILDYPGRP